jgi:DNA polymerase-3 subunit delta'
VSEPFEAARKSKSVVSEEEAEYPAPRALKILEEANKRELTARERRAMEEAIACAESLLRDVLALVEATGESVVNADSADTIRMLAEKTTTEGVLKALGACKQAVSDLARNVTPQLALEVMLLTIKEAL